MAQNTDSLTASQLLHARYRGHAPGLPTEDFPGSDIWKSQMQHRCVRKFLPRALPDDTLNILISAAQSAATSSNLQTWSVIALKDVEHKAEAAAFCGNQNFIREAPLFLVFCADLARLKGISQEVEKSAEGLDYMEMFVMSAIDASIAGQNAATAAEAMGMGICYVGAVRNKPIELAALLDLPQRVIALFGIAVGWPDEEKPSAIKPRLPQSAVTHLEKYDKTIKPEIEAYNSIMTQFYEEQNMKVHGNWSEHSAKRVASADSLSGRDRLREQLNERGFELK